jgi:hypothetical protein
MAKLKIKEKVFHILQWFYCKRHSKNNKNSVTVHGGRTIELHNEICKKLIKGFDLQIETIRNRLENTFFRGENSKDDIDRMNKLLYARNLYEKEMINNQVNLHRYFQKEYEKQFPHDKQFRS